MKQNNIEHNETRTGQQDNYINILKQTNEYVEYSLVKPKMKGIGIHRLTTYLSCLHPEQSKHCSFGLLVNNVNNLFLYSNYIDYFLVKQIIKGIQLYRIQTYLSCSTFPNSQNKITDASVIKEMII